MRENAQDDGCVVPVRFRAKESRSRPDDVERDAIAEVDVFFGISEQHRNLLVRNQPQELAIARQRGFLARHENPSHAIATENIRERKQMIHVRVTQNEQINRPVEERHVPPQFTDGRTVGPAVDHDLPSRRRHDQRTVTLADIEKIHMQTSIGQEQELMGAENDSCSCRQSEKDKWVSPHSIPDSQSCKMTARPAKSFLFQYPCFSSFWSQKISSTPLWNVNKHGQGRLKTVNRRILLHYAKLSPMKVLLLLAGRSRRFWPLSEKSLFPIAGKTLAEHQVETLKLAGVKDITLVVGAHNKKELKKLLPDLPQIEQKDLDLGMQGACMSALPKMKGGPVMIISGNDVIDPSAIKDLQAAAAKPGTDGAILARKVKKYFPGGYLSVKGGKITAIIEKPGEGKEPSKLINIVAHIHNDPATLLDALKNVKNHRDDGYELALQSLFTEKTYRAVPYEGFWQPVKYPWHLLTLLEHFLSQITKSSIHRSVKIHPSAVIDGNVSIGEGTKILPHATIVGPCVIGRNCIIGNNALVRGSGVGDDCVIGYNSEVKGSILAGPVWTHMTYLGDSIIGKNVSFGGGSTTGNLRLDEGEIMSAPGPVGARHAVPLQGEPIPTGLTKLGMIIGNDCRFSTQTSSYPGVKIGAGTFVSDCALLRTDIPDGSFVNVKDGIVQIRPNKTAVPANDQRGKYRKSL